MTDFVAALTNVSPVGILGIILIFAAIPLLLSASSWLIIKYTKLKSNQAVAKISAQVAGEELQTR